MDDLRLLKRSLTKEFGENAVVFASEIPQYELVSTGSLALDYACGGGIPNNRVVEYAGPEGAGKTTLGLITVSNFLMKYPDKGAVILDLEHRLTSSWIQMLIGPELMQRIIVMWPDDVEASTNAYLDVMKSGAVSVVLYDSIGGAPSQRVTTKDATKGNMGGNSLPVTRLAQFAQIFSDKYRVCTIFINQQRDDFSGYNKFVTPGGRGLKHACSLRVKVVKGREKIVEKIKTEEVQIGYSVRAQVIKNSIAPPHKEAYYLFYNVLTEKYGFGIDQMEELVRLGSMTGTIEQRGRGWFYHSALPPDAAGDRKVHGLPALMTVLRENDTIKEQIMSDIWEKLKSGDHAPAATSFNPDDLDEELPEPDFFTYLEVEE